MRSTKASCEPDTASASITATSLADLTIRACSAASTVISAPTGNPILLGDWLLASSEQPILLAIVSLPSLRASKVT